MEPIAKQVMEDTPKRSRRMRDDPPSGPPPCRPRSRHIRPTSLLDPVGEADCEKVSCDKQQATDMEGVTAGPASGAAAGDLAGMEDSAECLGDFCAAASAAAGGSDQASDAEVASLCVTRAEGGTIEFELDGKVYRVVDPAAFGEVVATAPRPPRRSLAALRRAQRVAALAADSSSSGGADACGSAAAPCEPYKASEGRQGAGEPAEALRRAFQAAAAARAASLPGAGGSGSREAATSMWGCQSLAEEMQVASSA
mmetsp:Transcript_11576/g.26397  ORF Transcript_11576/g.26397 Transcript_11576/m.26397 type:complete len:255 (+) Transcript_11576:75-839(+)|eukprot:CAMPEP_0197918264 /NCGR_PEP_ID=MMETSP1439-20131203/85145_1 /TAXON_ID=66791 /ORGANISM="Gonyaulax spinifera, Strain CCMP409" /LENGTH=254 /DNA_ID=CAMNT_0043540377 /DNA_START=59 /DNA_END=823 /DNA_ORIENTATION=+